jgi:6-pyruvoyltetrahydropterin/6-carboxytetrahydropterin synthase
MYAVIVEERFSAAHFLPDYEGECARLHGHNFTVRIYLKKERLDSFGMAVDFREAKRRLKEVLSGLDHRNLNELSVFAKTHPTSENIASYLFTSLKRVLSGLYKVSVSEQEGVWAEYTEDSPLSDA